MRDAIRRILLPGLDMRSLWTGAINFGLVNIPVKLYSASESHSLDLDMLHAKDLSPIRFARVCRDDGKEVPWDEIVKGYEYRKGDYIVLTKEDMAKAAPGRQDTLDIVAFADASEVDPAYFEKPYYLEPGKGAAKVYTLLCQALAESDKVAITKYVLRNREHLGCIRAQDDMLVMIQMRFADEIRNADAIKLPKQPKVTKPEMGLALQLIDQLTKPFDPSEYKDTYIEELERIIEEKAEGKKPTAAPAPRKAEVKDLMAALKQSIDEGKKGKLYLVHDSSKKKSDDDEAPAKETPAKAAPKKAARKSPARKKAPARKPTRKSA
jgi:DNA end-binding protein Ku